MRVAAVFLYVVIIAALSMIITAEDVAISAPDIFPISDAPVIGFLDVTIIGNAQRASVTYTINGQGDPVPGSTEYHEPFRITTPGTYIIKAKAFPYEAAGRLASSTTIRTFEIQPSPILPPTATPETTRKYRGSVSVALASAESDAKVQYVVDIPDPGNRWLTYTEPIVLDTPGTHNVMARVSVVRGGKTILSPAPKWRFVVEPPLTYDVYTECKKCDGEPAVGQPFSIFLQSAEQGSKLFLTTSMKGCVRHNHALDDAEEVTTDAKKLSYRFTTYAAAVEQVYVCLNEPSNGTWTMVPRIQRPGQGAHRDYFSIDNAQGAVVPQVPQPQKPTTYSGQAAPVVTSSQGSSIMIILWLCAAAMIIGMVKLLRGAVNAGGGARRRVPTEDV